MADGSGGFTNRLDDQRPEESDSPNQQLPQQLDSSSCRSAGFPEDFQKEENFDLINRYWADPDVPLTSYGYNLNPAAAEDQLCDKIAECINLARETPKCRGTSHVTASDEPHQSERAIGYL